MDDIKTIDVYIEHGKLIAYHRDINPSSTHWRAQYWEDNTIANYYRQPPIGGPDEWYTGDFVEFRMEINKETSYPISIVSRDGSYRYKIRNDNSVTQVAA